MFQKILIVDIPQSEFDQDLLERLQTQAKEVCFRSRDTQEFTHEIAETDVLLGDYCTPVGKDLIDRASQLRYVGLASISFEEIDLNYAAEKNIVVCNNSGYSSDAIAEFFFGAVLSHIRNLQDARDGMREGKYTPSLYLGWELQKKTLGILGLGSIGSRIADLGEGFGMAVKYYSRSRKPDQEARGREYCSLASLTQESDVFAVCVPYDDTTKALLSAELLSHLRPGTVVVNITHTNVFDFEVLTQKLSEGSFSFIQTYFDTIPSDHRDLLVAEENAIVYPSIAIATKETYRKRCEFLVESLELFAAGKTRNRVA